MSNIAYATVVLLRDNAGRVCLAPKKKNIHKAGEELEHSCKKWNGYGGKQEPGETIVETAIRELHDESGVLGEVEDLEFVAKISFFWPGNETKVPSMVVYFFFLSKYNGIPQEGVEMGVPKFFHPAEIPYDEMMPADGFFFPKILAGERPVCDIHHLRTADGKDAYTFEMKDGTPAL